MALRVQNVSGTFKKQVQGRYFVTSNKERSVVVVFLGVCANSRSKCFAFTPVEFGMKLGLFSALPKHFCARMVFLWKYNCNLDL